MVLYYQRVGLIASEALRPFDARHDGSLFGEGAAALMLETDASAAGRGAHARSARCSAARRAARPKACSRSATTATAWPARSATALADASLAPGDVGMIVAHGNGTPPPTRPRRPRCARVFGAAMPPVTAFKWAFGHLIAAAGILDAALALAALKQRVVPGVAPLGGGRARLFRPRGLVPRRSRHAATSRS